MKSLCSSTGITEFALLELQNNNTHNLHEQISYSEIKKKLSMCRHI
jgi:hypothetical protein